MNRSRARAGFSLIEIAVVLLIISLLVTIVAMPLAAQIEQQRTLDTQKQLEIIKEALYGFAIANGRLPCPATDGEATGYGAATSSGQESPVGGGTCTVKLGYVPAVTLGLTPVDSSGFAVDAWGISQNRILYAVAQFDVATAGSCTAQTKVLTTSNGVRTATMACLPSQTSLLSVCSTTPTGSAGAATACSGTSALTTTAPFVLVSKGKNAASGAVSGSDEAHNVDGQLLAGQDNYFVSRTPSVSAATGGEFDDIVTWGSLNTLFARMVQAGKLP